MEDTFTESRSSRVRTWLFGIGAVLLLLLTVFLNPPEGGARGREPGFLFGLILAGLMIRILITALVYGIARLIRKGKTSPGFVVVAFYTLLAMSWFNVASGLGGRRQRTSPFAISADERQGLMIEADSIRHPALGFSLPNPGPSFTPSPELQSQMDASLAKHPDMAAWVFSNEATSTNLVVNLTRFPFLNEKGFRDFARGVRNAARGSDWAVLGDSLRWAPPSGDYRLTVKHTNGLFMQTRCVSRSRQDGYFVVCVQTLASDSSALSHVREGLAMRH